MANDLIFICTEAEYEGFTGNDVMSHFDDYEYEWGKGDYIDEEFEWNCLKDDEFINYQIF